MKSFISVFILFFIANILKAQYEVGQSPIYSPNDSLSLSDTSSHKIAYIPVLNSYKILAPGNDNCASSTSLTIGAALLCGQTTNAAGIQVGECVYPAGGGMSEQTVWYRFTSTNDSLVLNYLTTNSNTFTDYVTIYGPFASGAGCLPACTSTVYTAAQNGDPGSHILLTGLATSGNSDYLIQIQCFSGGGAGDPYVNFCLNLANPASNTNANIPSIINQCGTTFNGTTNGGYWPTGTSAGFNNLDGNAGTTVTGASEAGDDVTFVINNVSWFKFCTVNAGTYNVQFDVISCAFTGLNSGSQMAILTGTANSLTNIAQAPNPTYTNTAVWTSPNFTLAANGCAYLVVDGFAGDACSYSYVLTNVSGGCVLLPVDLLYFAGKRNGAFNELTWATVSESNSDYFVVEKSKNGSDFEYLSQVNGGGNSTARLDYSIWDNSPFEEVTYYRLKQVDFDGNENYSTTISIEKELDKLSTMLVDYSKEETVELVYYSSKNANALLEIYDSNGSLISSKATLVVNGRNAERINKTSLSNGVYIAKLVVEGKIQIQKFVIN